MADLLGPYRSGSTEPWTADIIAAIVRAKEPHVVLETGTYRGLTSMAILDAMSSYVANHAAALYTVEGDPNRAKDAEAFLRSRYDTGTPAWYVIHGDALNYLRYGMKGRPEVIFLDDDHDADHVGLEVEAALAILAPGGVVLLHDAVGPFGLDRVIRRFGGVVLDLPRLHVAGGLGIISP